MAVGLVARARRANAPEALVVALRAEAWSERARLSNDRAKVLLDEAARVARQHRLDGRLGDVLITRAAVNHELGRLTAAQRDLDRAATLVGPARPAELDLQQAALLQNIGRLADAAALYRRVVAVPATPADVGAKVHNNLALIEVQRGRHQAAIDHLDQAAALADQVGPALVAGVTQSRGWVMVQAGKLVEGLRLFDRASRLYQDAGLPLGEPYIEYADALVDLRLLPEASEVARRAAGELEAHGVLLMAAEAQLRAASLALLTGDLHGAVAAAERATASFRRQRRTAWAARAVLIGVEARTRLDQVSPTELAAARRAAAHLERLGILSSAVEGYLTTGRLAAALGRAAAARGTLRRARELGRRAPVLVRLKGHLAAALAARLGQDDRDVLRHCRAGLADLTRHRAAFASMELRALASGHGAELGRLGLEVLLRGGSAPRVLDWMERTRAAALFAVEPPLTEGIEEELAALRVVHAELAEAVRASGGEPPELLAKQTAIESRVRRATWARQASVQAAGTPLPAAGLRELLGERVLVEYGVLHGELLAVVLEPKRARLLRLGPLEPARHEAELLLFALRRLARPGSPAALAAARTSADHGLRRLAGLLVAPLRLAGDASLVVVPPSVLQRVPWSALHRAPLSVAPSASFWARTLERRKGADGEVVLVAGPDLPGAVDEVGALRQLHASATVLLPPSSTVAAVSEALGGASLAHLACHGRLRADNPTFSSLALSDGPLTVHELDQRNLAPHRMILAACDSGAGVSYEGGEMLGFASALIARGTSGLVTSVVAVPDLEAVPLMRSLHSSALGGASLAESLHAARGAADTEHPGAFVNWCALTAFGAA